MDHAARFAEIARLRGAIAAGSRAVAAVHYTLARHFEELHRLDDAIAVYTNALRIAEDDGLLFYARVITRRLRWLVPNDDAIRANDAHVTRALARKGITFPLPRGDAPRGARADVLPLAPSIERHTRDRLRRATITVIEHDHVVHVVLPHEGSNPGPVAKTWFEHATYAIEVDDDGAFIPCIAAIIDAQLLRHELRVILIDPDAHARIRSHPSGLSNIRAIHIDTGIGAPHRVHNTSY
ncbi:MAG: hypothetical protein Q7S02_01035, partial [bacterium]|nr:hypothetical protein [bacterium]